MPIHKQKTLAEASNADASEIALDQLSPHGESNRQILNHWLGLRGGNQIVPWTEFDPLEIADVLTNCVIVEARQDGHYIVQLYGSALTELFGRDLTGADLNEIFQGDDRKRIGDRLDVVKNTPAVLCLISQLQSTEENWLQFEFLGVPFASEAGDVDHILFSTTTLEKKVSYKDKIDGIAPRRKTLETLIARL